MGLLERRARIGDRSSMADELLRWTILPNTAGCYTADEAVRTLRLARELGVAEIVKLEVIGDPKTLYPDNEQTLEAARILVKDGFVVLPYCIDDPIVCKKLEDIDEYLRLSKKVLRHLITEADPMTREELERLQTLFARKKAEQEKEEAESGKGKEERKPARKEMSEKKEAVPQEKPAEAAEAAEPETEKSEVEVAEIIDVPAPAAAEEKAPAPETKIEAPEVKEKKESKKSKIKLEELEDKLDEILEDTIV
jgi:hypothetical protein